MRNPIYLLALSASITSALQLPNIQPFLSAIPISISDYYISSTPQEAAQQAPSPHSQQQNSPPQPQTTPRPHNNLFRRQSDDTCPSGYNNCSNIGAPGLCCSPSARCQADNAGHVACCPLGAACTGSIGGAATAGSTDSSGGFAEATSSGAGDSGLLVTASTSQEPQETGDDNLRTSGGFVMDGTQTVATPGVGARGVQPVSLSLLWFFLN